VAIEKTKSMAIEKPRKIRKIGKARKIAFQFAA